jgi:hypothetical protein
MDQHTAPIVPRTLAAMGTSIFGYRLLRDGKDGIEVIILNFEGRKRELVALELTTEVVAEMDPRTRDLLFHR